MGRLRTMVVGVVAVAVASLGTAPGVPAAADRRATATAYGDIGPSAAPTRVRPLYFSTSESMFTRRTDNQGWWSNRSNASDSLDNYFVGAPRDGQGIFRNFFTFDLYRLHRRIVDATLEVRRYRSRGEATEVLGLFAVATPARRLNANSGRNQRIFHDLGSGQRYGRFPVSTRVGQPSLLQLHLNRAAVRDINAARGGFFSVGGSLLSIGDGREFLFAFSRGDGVQRLVVQLHEPHSSSAPAP